VLVENQQSLEDLERVLIGSFLPDLLVEFLVGQGLFSLESLERKGGSELRSFIGCGVYDIS
jgi:hypothetical protein